MTDTFSFFKGAVCNSSNCLPATSGWPVTQAYWSKTVTGAGRSAIWPGTPLTSSGACWTYPFTTPCAKLSALDPQNSGAEGVGYSGERAAGAIGVAGDCAVGIGRGEEPDPVIYTKGTENEEGKGLTQRPRRTRRREEETQRRKEAKTQRRRDFYGRERRGLTPRGEDAKAERIKTRKTERDGMTRMGVGKLGRCLVLVFGLAVFCSTPHVADSADPVRVRATLVWSNPPVVGAAAYVTGVQASTNLE